MPWTPVRVKSLAGVGPWRALAPQSGPASKVQARIQNRPHIPDTPRPHLSTQGCDMLSKDLLKMEGPPPTLTGPCGGARRATAHSGR